MKLTFRILTNSGCQTEVSLLLGIDGIVSGEGVLLLSNTGSKVGSGGGSSLVSSTDSEVLSGCTTVIGSLIVVSTLIFSAAMLFRMIIISFNFIK